jgi:hypothetical protein
MQIQDFCKDLLCLKSHPTPKESWGIQTFTLCYGKQQSLALQDHVLNLQVGWYHELLLIP